MLVASAMNHDWTWVIYSSENKTAAVKMKLMQFALNKQIGRTTYQEELRLGSGLRNISLLSTTARCTATRTSLYSVKRYIVREMKG